MSNKQFKPTSYVVKFWNPEGTVQTKEEVYPMHLYSLNEVIELLKGKECECDIYESRYWKRAEEYVTVGKTFVWNSYDWIELP